MQLCERYRNPDDDLEWLEEADCVLFSSSLDDKRPPLWEDKFIDAKSEKVINKKSLSMLKKDKIIK